MFGSSGQVALELDVRSFVFVLPSKRWHTRLRFGYDQSKTS